MYALLAAALAASFHPSGHDASQTAPAVAAPEAAAPEAAASGAPVLESAIPWWEKVTVTVDDKGKQQSCRYEKSAAPGNAEACDEELAANLKVAGSDGSGVYSKVTFERRFSPNGRLDAGRLHPGDELIGRQVMFLTLDTAGAIESCHVVMTSGDVPDYDCDRVRKEQFKAQASTDAAARQAFMTVLVFGHSEQIA